MRKIIFVGLLVFAFAGCAAVKQGIDDYKTGKSTPLVNGEVAPSDQAHAIIDPLSGLPVVGGFAPTAALVLTGLFTFLRGRRIRQANGAVSTPATGFLGSNTGIETVVQTVSNIVAGAFEVGPDNSPWKRAWKVLLSTAIGGGTLALTVPAVKDFVVLHPGIALGISGASAIFAGLEKQLSIILPVAPATAAPAAPTSTITT